MNFFQSHIAPHCADGYQLSKDNSYCYKVDTEAAVQNESENTTQHFTNVNYGVWGTIFYKAGLFNQNGTWDINNQLAWPDLYTDRDDTDFVNVNVTQYPTGLWVNEDYTLTKSRLNVCGLWKYGNQNYIGPLGFSRTFTIPTSGYYYMGVGSDNYCTITIDNNVIVEQDYQTLAGTAYLNDTTTTEDTVCFRYWHMYPVYLTAGTHTIQITSTNLAYAGVLGVEIYNATEEQLVACASQSDLTAYTIFSTKDIADGSSFDIGNYSCSSSDYTLVYDSVNQTYSCQKIETDTVKY